MTNEQPNRGNAITMTGGNMPSMHGKVEAKIPMQTDREYGGTERVGHHA